MIILTVDRVQDEEQHSLFKSPIPRPIDQTKKFSLSSVRPVFQKRLKI